MKCLKKEIPSYLHWNGRKIYDEKYFCYFQKFYRIKSRGNPIEIPSAWLTAISGKWSRLIKKKDLITPDDSQLGDDYDFAFIKEIRSYQRVCVLDEQKNQYAGTHILSCVVKHNPLPCNYSHSEILIRHQIYRQNESQPFFDETYSYDSWDSKTALLKRMKSKFFKDLKSEFRVDMIKLISRNSLSHGIKLNILAFLNLTKWNKIRNN